ncbi:RNA polymerase sigma factor FliA [Endozoicomonas sp. OPT23]|uniref:RNA polymerase sigma factor FliA n=1 Tax=Endozoicomonas sp. OPT23 TaxID=2072845 RepID=UPI00129A625C|nr:RNA polymerase sigma factor FliA [Endozoicomonas sp. OPT23]MRI33913.1 RNA polymerase sigma factor FliA [Endozoicomonas sp. OPT23]
MTAVALTYSSHGRMKYVEQEAPRSNKQRDQLVMEHAAMVKRVAVHLADRLDGAVETDDLIQTGLIGLLEAAERYEPVEGVPFEAYALSRVRGAMMDSLRRNDWCPRNIRKQGRMLRESRRELQQLLGREPHDREVAEQVDMSIDDYQHVISALDRVGVISLDLLREKGDSCLPLEGDISSQPVMKQRLQKAFSTALKQLPEREQIIMALYYDEEMNQKEIARVLDLTEARISQLRSKAVKTLRGMLSEWT